MNMNIISHETSTTIMWILYFVGVGAGGAVMLFMACLGNGMRFSESIRGFLVVVLWPVAIPMGMLVILFKALKNETKI